MRPPDAISPDAQIGAAAFTPPTITLCRRPSDFRSSRTSSVASPARHRASLNESPERVPLGRSPLGETTPQAPRLRAPRAERDAGVRGGAAKEQRGGESGEDLLGQQAFSMIPAVRLLDSFLCGRLGFTVKSLGVRISGLEFRVQGLGFRDSFIEPFTLRR